MNILITGGASGLGEAITQCLAKDNSNSVLFTYAKSEQHAIKITSDLKNTTAVHCDFSNSESVNNLCENITDFNPDILINNAYLDFLGNTHFQKIPEEIFFNDFKFNLLPTLKITQSAIAHFRKKKSGKIITILSSYLHQTPPIGLSCYVASKAYLGSMVKSWAAENEKFNIKSLSVSPSFMLTNLNANVDERVIEQMIANHPKNKLLTPGEVADAIHKVIKSGDIINGTDIAIA